MKKLFPIALACAGFIILVAATRNSNPYGLTKGNAAVQSISAIAFGPDGIFFIGDYKSASVIAIDKKD